MMISWKYYNEAEPETVVIKRTEPVQEHPHQTPERMAYTPESRTLALRTHQEVFVKHHASRKHVQALMAARCLERIK